MNTKFFISENINDQDIVEFLNIHPDSSVYNHPAWLNAIQRTLNQNAFYLVSKNDKNEIDGLIPFIETSGIIRGKKIISFPLSTYCNPLIKRENLKEAIQFIRDYKGQDKIIDFRATENFSNELSEFQITSEYCTHILKLKSTIEETFDSFHPTSVRASIRRAEKNNLTIEWNNSTEHLNIFNELEFRLRKRLQLPPIPFKFFKNVFDELRQFNMISLPVVFKDKIPVAAGFILNYKDTFYLEYTASDKDYINLYPNHKLFFDVIRKAHISGAKFVDFGRTALNNTGLIIFKEKWAAEKVDIYHHTYPHFNNIKSDSSKARQILLKVNSLLPDWLLKLEGEILYRYFY